MRLIVVLLVLCQLSAVLTLSGMELLKDGKYLIKGVVIEPNASRANQHAAHELRVHLAKVAKSPLPPLLKDDGKLPPGSYIFIGNTVSAQKAVKLPEQMVKSYGEINVIGDDIYICGKDEPGNWQWDVSQGSLYSVYEFIEKFLGIRWLWPGDLGTYVPVKKNISVPEGKTVVVPRLAASRWRIGASTNGWSSDNSRFRFMQAQKLYMKRHRFSWDFDYQHGHAFVHWWRMYGDKHPEFFCMLPDGTRGPSPTKFVSMCVTNKAFAKEVVRQWAANPKRRKTINANENDTAGFCMCDECLKADNSSIPMAQRKAEALRRFKAGDPVWHRALGSVSDRYCQFYMNVQKEADKIDKNAIVFGLVYANYSEAPTGKVKLNDRVVLRFCPQIMYPWTEDSVNKFKREWKGWSDTGAKLLFRPNFTSDGQAFPIQYHHEYYEVFNYALANGMVGSDLDSCTGCWSSQPLVNFVVAQTNHDSASLEQMEADFYAAFGPAKDLVKEYFEYITQVTMYSGYKSPFKGDTIEGGVLFLDMLLVADSLFTEEVLAKCYDILHRAQKVKGLSKEESYRLIFLLSGLDNVKLMIAAQKEFRKYKAGGNVSNFANAVAKLDKFRNSVEFLYGINIGYLQWLEGRHWPSREMLKIYEKNATEMSGWKIRFDPQEVGLKEKWYAPEANWSKDASIGVDSHWEKQPYGKAWAAKHGGKDFKGIGWYRMSFDMDEVAGDYEFVFIAVDGTATFYLNGQKIGDRPYPYKGNANSWRDSFKVAIPKGLLKKKNNVLTVSIDKRIGLCGIWKSVFIAPADKK